MPILRTALKYSAAAAGATGAVVSYKAFSLSRQYPWIDDTAPNTSGPLPKGTGHPGHIRAVIKNNLIPNAARVSPIDTFLAAFYSTWTLRLEAWGGKKAGYVTVPPPHVQLPGTQAFMYANGLFQGIYRDPNGSTVMVAWNAPGGKPGKPSPGGIHVFTASINPDGDLELTFGGAEWEPPYGPKLDGAVGTAVHHFYSRYLLDSAKHAIEVMAKAEN